MLSLIRIGLAAFVIGFVVGMASCTPLPADSGIGAAAGNDPTLVISGCGQAPHKGYLFCQVRERASPSASISLTVPKSSCSRAECTRVQFTRLDGSYGFAAGIPKNQGEIVVPLSTIVGSEGPITPAVDGEYQALVKVFYESDGQEHVSVMKGFIRVNVLKAEYQPIGCNDPAVAWEVTKQTDAGKCTAQWTTLLRGAICGKCDST